ncbi:MAG: phytoene/squalene synthase family protein [Opitutaceae bacterium]|nr:phytoene/squalene synthase family protein [Cytophagales bacterium]
MELYNSTNLLCSKLITNRYSTSFSLGIKALHNKFRMSVYAIYGFVRFADEIVDTFHDSDKAELLKEFKKETYLAINRGISLNPVLHSFQFVVNKFGIERELIDAFLDSMEADLLDKKHDHNSYNTYIYGSAEVVGLMCLRVFCEGNKVQYDSLKPFAQRLGAAFQKVNFLRDVKSDYQERGRVYFPGVNFSGFSTEAKNSIESDIAEDFKISLQGIKKLPMGSRFGVYLAYVYYKSLFNKIKRMPVARIQNERVRIPDQEKFLLFIESWVKYKFI